MLRMFPREDPPPEKTTILYTTTMIHAHLKFTSTHWNCLRLTFLVLFVLSVGMDLVNISLDTLRPDRFERMTRRRGLERVLETIDEAIELGYDPVKVSRIWGLGSWVGCGVLK